MTEMGLRQITKGQFIQGYKGQVTVESHNLQRFEEYLNKKIRYTL